MGLLMRWRLALLAAVFAAVAVPRVSYAQVEKSPVGAGAPAQTAAPVQTIAPTQAAAPVQVATPAQLAEPTVFEPPLREEPSITAYVFGAKDSSLNRAMAARLLVALANTGRYQVSEGYVEFFEQAVGKQKSANGALSAEQLKDMGQRLGVDYVCVADLVSVFDEYRAFAYILRVKTGKSTANGASDISLKALPDLTAASEQIVESMFKKAQSSAVAQSPAPTFPHITQPCGQHVACPPCGEFACPEGVASASTRKSKTGFTVGYGFSGEATILQLGVAHVHHIPSSALSLVAEANFWSGGWTENHEVVVSNGYGYATKNVNEKFSFYGMNIPVLFKVEKSPVFAEGGVFLDILSGTADNTLAGYDGRGTSVGEWMANVGITVGGGLSFGKGYTQYFYRFNYGTAYYSQIVGIRQLF